MKSIFYALLMLCFATQCYATARPDRPKLVVGIVVDQMRWDYLVRYAAHYGDGGFKRLMNNGFSCDNTQVDYIPTVTAIGHSCVYTGSVPAVHGIAGNNFYKDGKPTYCTDDAGVEGVGSKSKAGRMSPRNLLVTTMGDELRLATNFRSKVVGVALKDRAAILPAGHAPNGAYWFDDATGRFITSTYYMTALPEWVKAFNKRDEARQLLSQKWETLLPAADYAESTTDDVPYEKPLAHGQKPTLPADLPHLFKEKGYSVIRPTPFGNTLTLEMAKAAIAGESMGQDEFTDLLAVSLSSTDYVGHQFGVNAIETEDTYVRLDRDLSDFFTTLDKTVGPDNYIVFLTADHAAAHNWRFLADHKIPARNWNAGTVKDTLNSGLSKRFGTAVPLVRDVLNYQVFLNHEAIDSLHLNLETVRRASIDLLLPNKHFAYVADMSRLSEATIPVPARTRAINGYNRFRSGDIQLIMQPGFYEGEDGGTNHGVWNPYDAHIPLLFMGHGIKAGQTMRPTHMTDIAPTICALLGIQMPNGCIGNAILPILGEE